MTQKPTITRLIDRLIEIEDAMLRLLEVIDEPETHTDGFDLLNGLNLMGDIEGCDCQECCPSNEEDDQYEEDTAKALGKEVDRFKEIKRSELQTKDAEQPWISTEDGTSHSFRDTDLVEVRTRNGYETEGPAGSFVWANRNWPSDIVSYRLIQGEN